MSLNGARMMVKLKYVETVDFRKSEATNYKALPADIRDSLRDGDAVCFKSGIGDQVVFVVKPRTIAGTVPRTGGGGSKSP